MTPKPDPYTTVCIHCPGGPKRKPNGLFTPGELQRRHPKCRACISDINSRRGRGRSRTIAGEVRDSLGKRKKT